MSRRIKSDPEEAARLRKEMRHIVNDINEIVNLKSGAGVRILNYIINRVSGVNDIIKRGDFVKADRDFIDGARNVGNQLLEPARMALMDRNPKILAEIQFLDIYYELTKTVEKKND